MSKIDEWIEELDRLTAGFDATRVGLETQDRRLSQSAGEWERDAALKLRAGVR